MFIKPQKQKPIKKKKYKKNQTLYNSLDENHLRLYHCNCWYMRVSRKIYYKYIKNVFFDFCFKKKRVAMACVSYSYSENTTFKDIGSDIRFQSKKKKKSYRKKKVHTSQIS